MNSRAKLKQLRERMQKIADRKPTAEQLDELAKVINCRDSGKKLSMKCPDCGNEYTAEYNRRFHEKICDNTLSKQIERMNHTYRDSSVGFLSIDREKTIKENWPDILAMKRPATVRPEPKPAEPQEYLGISEAKIREEDKSVDELSTAYANPRCELFCGSSTFVLLKIGFEAGYTKCAELKNAEIESLRLSLKECRADADAIGEFKERILRKLEVAVEALTDISKKDSYNPTYGISDEARIAVKCFARISEIDRENVG